MCICRHASKTAKHAHICRYNTISVLRELTVHSGTAEGKNNSDAVLNREDAALADPAVGKDDDRLDAKIDC